MGDLSLLESLAVVLGVALVGSFTARLLKQPVILGYLLGGIAVGPHGFELVDKIEDVETLATIGVVLLMFTLGIEFSLKTLRRVGSVAVFGGIAQITATIALGLVVGLLMDWSVREAVLFGFFIALSSTVIVLKILMERGEINSPHGRVMIGILLVQDLSVVPMMVILTSLDESGTALAGAIGWSVLRTVIFLGVLFIAGLWALPRFMQRIAGGRSRELFLLAVVCLSFAAAFGGYYVGLSIALGAFLVGLFISESEYAYQALADIRPLRDIFAILFFVSLGMLADPGFVADNPGKVAAIVAAILLGKFVIASIIPRTFGYSVKTSLFVGSGLLQIGEFSFVLAALALEEGLVTDDIFSLTLAAALITIMLTPFAMSLTSVLYHRVMQSGRLAGLVDGRADPGEPEQPEGISSHVVICGYGRTAKYLSPVLERRNLSYLVIDIDPRAIDTAREKGIPCIYGDAANPDILARANLEKAKVLVVAFPDPVAARLVVANARRINSRLDIVARVHREEDTEALRKLGVAELVRPELESGLEIIRHTLHRFGLTIQEIQYIINVLREEEV